MTTTSVSNAGPRQSLAAILTVEGRGGGDFAARLEDFWGASLGGDILARAALAAAMTCEGRQLHSLHACFLRPVPPGVPIRLLVESLEDAALRARRQVRLLDDGPLCHVVASFVPPGSGPSYQDLTFEPGLPVAEKLPSTLEQARIEGWTDYAQGPIEFRRVSPLWPDASAGEPCTHIEWVRPRVPLPDDTRLQMAAVVFLSGFYSHWAFERRVGRTFAHDRFVPLDHVLWIHRTLDWDDWWLLRATSHVSAAGRALARREIYTKEGLLIASAAHEAVVASR